MGLRRGAEASPAPVPAPARGFSTPWGDLGKRGVVEMAVPGLAIGLLGGIIAGALVVAGGLGLDVALVATLALGVPMALAGAGYELLLAKGKAPLSALAPVALYFAVAFPLVRIMHAGILDLYAGASVAVPHGWLDFVVYQVLLSVAFAIGYWWLHENFAPRWWYHVRERNPVANHFIRVQLHYAAAAEQQKQQRRERQEAQRRQRKRR